MTIRTLITDWALPCIGGVIVGTIIGLGVVDLIDLVLTNLG